MVSLENMMHYYKLNYQTVHEAVKITSSILNIFIFNTLHFVANVVLLFEAHFECRTFTSNRVFS